MELPKVDQAHRDLLDGTGSVFGRAREFLASRGISKKTATEFKLGAMTQHGGALVIPYMNPDGTVRTARYRTLDDRRYLWPTGSGVHLYNVAKTTSRRVWLTEGEFDAHCLHQLGFDVVGVPGVNTFKRAWRFLFTNCEQVTLVFDPDGPGQDGASRVQSDLGNIVEDVRSVNLPGGKDVNEWFLENPEKLRGLVA